MSDDFLQELDAQQKQQADELPSFRQAVTISPAQARQAATQGQRGLHGRKKQLTTRIPEPLYEELMGQIKKYAEDLHMYQNDVQLWALWRGLQALQDGEQPQLAAEIKKRPLKL